MTTTDTCTDGNGGYVGTHLGYDPEDDYCPSLLKAEAASIPPYCVVECGCWRTTKERVALTIGYCAADVERKERYAFGEGGHICLFPGVREMVVK